MAIIDKNQHNWIDDTTESQDIGLKLPLILDNGREASTKTTLEAVKQNILNLCNTELGERVMQPNLGIALKRFLFEPVSADLYSSIKSTIEDGVSTWMPFVLINNIQVQMDETDVGDFRNTMRIFVDFSLKKDPNVSEGIETSITGGT